MCLSFCFSRCLPVDCSPRMRNNAIGFNNIGEKMTIDEIKAALKSFNLKRVAADIGVPYVTVWRFATGKTDRPSWHLVEALKRYVRGVAGDRGQE